MRLDEFNRRSEDILDAVMNLCFCVLVLLLTISLIAVILWGFVQVFVAPQVYV